MGSWGPGIFDNDAARDRLFELTRELAEQLAAEVSAERRAVIVATFQKLRQLVRQCWEE